MATNRQVVCDECGDEIVVVRESENLTEKVVCAGGISGGINRSGRDLCAKHLKQDHEAQQIVRGYVVATA